MYKALFEDDIVSDIKNMRFAESFRSLQQYYGKIGDNAFLCGRFLNVFPIGPNKVNNKVWQTMMSYYLRLPILGEFERRPSKRRPYRELVSPHQAEPTSTMKIFHYVFLNRRSMRGEVLEWGSIVFLGAKTSIVKSALVLVLVLVASSLMTI